MKPDATPTLKICLLGEYGVGKSSLANRWVFDQFSEVYTSTIGVRTLACTAVWQDRRRQRCVVWDVVGEPSLSELTRRYLVCRYFTIRRRRAAFAYLENRARAGRAGGHGLPHGHEASAGADQTGSAQPLANHSNRHRRCG